MKNFLLICKSWLKSLLNLKVIFFVFLLINVVFAAVLSTFLEVKNQMNEQISSNKTTITDTKNNLLIDSPENNVDWKNLACTDFEEEKKLVSGKEKIKRRSKLTVNGENSCIKTKNKIERKNNKIPFFDNLINNPRILNFMPTDQNKAISLDFNEKSYYFQRSQYYKLIKLYEKTKNKKYLEWSNLIKKKILKEILKKLIYLFDEKKQKISLQKQIRQNEVNKIMSLENVLKEIEEMQLLKLEDFSVSSDSEKIENKLIKFMNANFVSKNRKELITKIIKYINKNKEKVLNENIQKTRQVIKNEIQKIEKWNKLKLLGKWNFSDQKQKLKKHNFLKAIKEKFQELNSKNSNSILDFLKEKLNSKEWWMVLKWIEQKEKSLASKESTSDLETNWILANFHKIMSIIKLKINENKIIVLLKKINKYLLLF